MKPFILVPARGKKAKPITKSTIRAHSWSFIVVANAALNKHVKHTNRQGKSKNRQVQTHPTTFPGHRKKITENKVKT